MTQPSDNTPQQTPLASDTLIRIFDGLQWLGGAIGSLNVRIDQLERRLDEHMVEAERRSGAYARDQISLLLRMADLLPSPKVRLFTKHPIALGSDDHQFPLGAAQDNTRCPRFVRACERLLSRQDSPDRPLRALDLGCAGGGCVLDFALRGHRAVGLEGSDHPLKSLRAEWRILPKHLFTCDLTEPYEIQESETGGPMSFNVITAWELLEHIPAERLPTFFANVRKHLDQRGVFVASVATFPCTDPKTGAVYHVTIQPREWWLAQAAKHGLVPSTVAFTTADFARGSGNGPSWQDWNAQTQPEMGFHLVLTRGG
jgi:2-polyprenyl-3-methyl-5-hydroxy-6-metoxy-1,4-benzoquinol methylase